MSSHTEGSTKAIYYALFANGGIAITKFIAAFFTGSAAMAAEAIHSLADCTNQVFLLQGLKEAKRPADDMHPLGYGRVVYFWAMMVALLLFFVGGAYSVMEGIKHFQHPEPLRSATVALIVLGIAIALESFSLYKALEVIREVSNGQPFLKWFRATRQSELMVIAGEDIAALAGLIIAFIAVLMTMISGNPRWDAAGSILVGLLLIIVAIFIMREVKAMITGESASPEVHDAIKLHVEGHPEVEQVIHLITLQMGTDMMVAIQAKIRSQTSDQALVDAINQVERSIHAKWPHVKWCFFEPDSLTGHEQH